MCAGSAARRHLPPVVAAGGGGCGTVGGSLPGTVTEAHDGGALGWGQGEKKKPNVLGGRR